VIPVLKIKNTGIVYLIVIPLANGGFSFYRYGFRIMIQNTWQNDMRSRNVLKSFKKLKARSVISQTLQQCHEKRPHPYSLRNNNQDVSEKIVNAKK